jgi:hypothetical protein
LGRRWLPERTRTRRLAVRGGRLHRPGDPRAGPRDADVTRRATASVRHRTAASRGETNGRTAPTQAVPWHDRFHHSGVVVPAMPMPRTQPSCRGRPDDCMARMMRKSNRVRSKSDAALLLLSDIRLPVCHGRERPRRPTLTIASTIHAARAQRSRPTANTGPSSGGRGRRQPPGVAHVCFLRMRSSACRCRLEPGGSRLRPDPSVRGLDSARPLLSSRRRGPGYRNGDVPLTGNQGAGDGQFAAAPVRRNRFCIGDWPTLRTSARAPLPASG